MDSGAQLMARTFTQAGGDYLEVTGVLLVTAAPMTIACWYKPTGVNSGYLVALNNAAIDHYFRLLWQQPQPKLSAIASTNLVAGQADSANTATVDVQHHACGVFTSNSSRFSYTDGVPGSEQTTTVLPIGVVDIEIGRKGAGFPSVNADISEIAIWDTALTSGEVARLSQAHGSYVGYSAKLIQPAHLKHYWRITGSDSPEVDEINGANLTVVGTTAATHPLIDYGPLTLWERLDETTADDTDYVTSGATPVNDTMKIGLSPLTAPQAGAVTFTFRHRLHQ